MKTMIYLEDAIDAIEHRLAEPAYQHTGEDWYVGMNCAESELYDLPSAESEQPTGVQDILQYLDEYLHPIVSPEHWSVYSELYDMVSMLPAAEPEIIRCQYCKHNTSKPNAGNASCELFYGMSDQYGFCHRAERKTDEEADIS